jgi:hypothetical protein
MQEYYNDYSHYLENNSFDLRPIKSLNQMDTIIPKLTNILKNPSNIYVNKNFDVVDFYTILIKNNIELKFTNIIFE